MAGRAVTRRAPGKLLVAGEYAVLQPGQPAVVVAVNRYVTVTACAAEGAEIVIDSDLLDHEVRLCRSGEGLRTVSLHDPGLVRGVLAHLVSVVETVEGLRTEQGLGLAPLRLTVRSDLHHNGIKIGLGSSAAVTVAATQAVADHYGMRLSPQDHFRLALLASIRVDAGPSGADLAAAAWRGWVVYRAPDRHALRHSLHLNGVARTLRTHWPDFAVRALPPPPGLVLHAGWSGSPASTSALVAGLAAKQWWRGTARDGFLADSERCATAVARALQRGEPQALLDAVRSARHLLARLDTEAALGIFTPSLRLLCEVAESCGGAAKPSGAGGGDCGIALLPDHRSPTLLRQRWSAAGITPLPLEVTADAAPDAGQHDAGPAAGPSSVSTSLRGHA
ncbi:phosphomevalonate kinase [Streptomyces sp. NEAU-W12]|uniref:phosphomevalonate kinase n=1 Tax=Streptomyces sp. NEAU-W12 TaxID=2994668 RepID=UPI00224B1430|nr:phosphomevalonate kinase [Streptomyces sp. NEAU-W12]MCX2926325.1 phosphomevalonate kinase [Streptomyces sp. NEAU-W12]